MALTNEDLQAIATLLQPINSRLDKIDADISSLKDSNIKMEADISSLKDSNIKMEADISSLKDSNIKIEADISALKVGQRDLRKEMREIKDKVSDTYDLALEAWGQSTENRTWLEHNQATG